MAESERVYMSGFLRKRQRGKHIRRESQRKNLKFQERFCTLTEHSFSYSKKENSKARGSFPAARIKLVTYTDPRAFKRGLLASPDVYFQVGDESEVLYLIASTKTEGDKWKEAFLKVIAERGNTMLERYHWGAYGSKTTGQWSCCNESRKDASGCRSVTTLTRKDSDVSQISTQSDDTLKSDNDSSTSSIKHSSSCSSKHSSASIVNEYKSPTIHLERVKFDNDATRKFRSRAGTSESGIDVNQHTRAGAKRQQLSSVDSDSDRSITSSPDILSDEFEEMEDEGIGRNVSKHRQDGTQAEGEKETTHIDQGAVSTVTCNMLIPEHTLTFPKSPSTLLLHQNDKGIIADTELDQNALKKLEITMELEHSFKLFRPLTTLTYFSRDSCLISGSFGMVYIWDTANDLIKQSLPVAGKVVSLDTWTDCLAVGSEVVQIIQLNDLKTKGPKRTIYAKKGELMPKIKSDSIGYNIMVAFVGNEGHLASAKVGGDTINIWPPPPVKSYAVTKSLFDIDVKGSSIVSITASKDPDNSWVAAVTSIPGSAQPHGTLHLWNRTSWKSEAPQIYITLPTPSASSKVYLSFLHTGRSIAIGNGQELCTRKCENGELLKKKTLGNDITCLTCKSDSQHNFIAVCTSDGKASLYDTHGLHELCKIPTNQNAYAIHVTLNETSFLFVSCDDTLQIWNDQLHTNDELVPSRYCLGMELCSEGILSQRRMLPINESQPLNLSFDEHDVHLELPQEVLQEKASLEVAFVPYNNAGPFEFPDGVIPVSPLVWFCLHPQRSTVFTSPTTIKLPLCFDNKLNKEDMKLLCFLKAEHKDITVNEDGQTVVKFNLVDQTKTQFQPDSPYGVVRDHHFCIYCLGYSGLKENLLKKVMYCLTIQKPIMFPKGEKREIHCILHYNLPGCRELVKQQMAEDYVMLSETLQFDKPKAALVLTVEKDEAQRKGWMTALVSKKLYTDDVNFFNLYELGTLESDCNENKYPPRMVIEVSSDCNSAVFPSVINLSFTGATRSFSKEISLICPLNEGHLHALGSERQDQGNGHGPTNRQPRPFLEQHSTPN